MRTLESMCHILNRLLEIDQAAANRLFATEIACTVESWTKLLEDEHVTVDLTGDGVFITPLLLINSLVSEHREDGEYAIFRDVSAQRETINFFVAKVSRPPTSSKPEQKS